MTADMVTASAMAYLHADHQRLDGLMARCVASMAAGEIATAATTFTEFRHGLLRHINIEESLLFPAFEVAAGLDPQGGPTAQMRHEHKEITRLLVLIQDCFAEQRLDKGMFERLRSELVGILGEHNAKEEQVVYPMTDKLVPAAQLELLIRQMRSL